MKLSACVIHLQRDGMRVGDALFSVFQDKGDVQRIARPPYASLAVDESFQSFFDAFAARIEAAGGLILARHHAQVSFLTVVRGADKEGNSLRRNLCKSV